MSAYVALPARIAEKVRIDGDGCWTWTAALMSGYGWVYFGGKARRAHRVVYELLVGPVPAGLDLDHLCRNRPCVNPDHLEPVTRRQNILRGLCGYAPRTLCRSGRHDITDPANIRTRPGTGVRQCLPCLRESGRRASRRYRASHLIGEAT